MDEKEYIELLKSRSQVLQNIRDEELRNAPHPLAAIEALDGPFRYALRANPPKPYSGLVEFHKILAKHKG
jgi:hypothetical protein